MFRVNNKKSMIFLLLLIILLILGVILYRDTIFVSQKTATLELTTTIEPTPTLAPKTATISRVSPDGKITLILKTKEKTDQKTDYNLFVTSEDLPTEKLIFSETINSEPNIEIPFNAWSPDKKHFFIKQNNNNSQEYLVFKASGEKFENSYRNDIDDLATEDLFINIRDLYIEAEIPFILDEITGWSAPYLLIIKTVKEDVTDPNIKVEGPSYWFDVSRQNFTRLSTQF